MFSSSMPILFRAHSPMIFRIGFFHEGFKRLNISSIASRNLAPLLHLRFTRSDTQHDYGPGVICTILLYIVCVHSQNNIVRLTTNRNYSSVLNDIQRIHDRFKRFSMIVPKRAQQFKYYYNICVVVQKLAHRDHSVDHCCRWWRSRA